MKLLFCLAIISFFVLLFGCTENNFNVPFTNSQFIAQSTDLNYVKFYAGEYDGNGLIIDGNIFTIFDLNGSSGSGSFTDTNFETAGLTLTGSNTGDQDLTGLVPYVGATSNVDLGANNLTTNYLDIGASIGDWVRMAKIGSGSTTNGEGGYIEFPSSTIDGYGAQIGGIRNSDGAGKGDLIIKTGGNAQVERFRVTNDGDVGIGTPNPTGQLDIQTSDADKYNTQFVYADGTSGGGFFDSSYNGMKLVLKDLSGTAKISLEPVGNNSYISGDFKLDGGQLNAQTGAGTALRFGANVNSDDLTDATRKFGRIGMPHYNIAEDDVGIFVGDSDGTDNRLTFGGGSSALNAATEIIFRTAEDDTTGMGTARLTIKNNGDVGIGTPNPGEKLEVDGVIKATEIKALHKTADGTSAVADGEYVIGIGNDTNGSITIKDGLITSITEAS